MCRQISSVPLLANPRGVVVQQGDLSADQKGPARLAYCLEHLSQGIEAGDKVCAVHVAGLDSFESTSEFYGVLRIHFAALCGDSPAIVLHEVQNGELVKRRHLQRFGNLPFGHGSIADRAHADRRGLLIDLPRKTHLF